MTVTFRIKNYTSINSFNECVVGMYQFFLFLIISMLTFYMKTATREGWLPNYIVIQETFIFAFFIIGDNYSRYDGGYEIIAGPSKTSSNRTSPETLSTPLYIMLSFSYQSVFFSKMKVILNSVDTISTSRFSHS